MSESNVEQNIVAIVIRDFDGQLFVCQETYVHRGASVTFIPVSNGVVAVIAEVWEGDKARLEELLKNY